MTRSSFSAFRNYDSVIAAVTGFLIIAAFSRHGGIGVSPDSVTYISVATNIHDHSAIMDFMKAPMMDFPAGYPVFLSCIMFLTGLDCMHFGAVLNGVLFALLIFLCGWIMEHFSTRSRWYKWIMLSIIVISPCLLEIYSMLWSETLFIVLLALFIICSGRYFQSHSTPFLLLMGFTAALACVTRYAGITLIGTGGLLILLDRGLPWKKKTGHLLLFGIVGISLLCINLYRNKIVTSTLTGYREKGITTLGRNLHDFGSVFCDWLPLPSYPGWLATAIGLFWILFFLTLFGIRLARGKRVFSFENIAVTYFIIYALFILFSATISRFQPLDNRLLSPLFLPWLWGAGSWIPGCVMVRTGSQRIPILVAALVIAIGFQAGQVVDDLETWDGVKYAGIPGYTEDGWRNSETMNFVRGNKPIFQRPGSTLYSNAYEGIWFLAGMRADMIPHKEFAKDVKEFLAEDHFYIVWFNDSINPDLLNVNFISRYKKLAAQKDFNDGVIYYFVTDSTAWKHPAFK